MTAGGLVMVLVVACSLWAPPVGGHTDDSSRLQVALLYDLDIVYPAIIDYHEMGGGYRVSPAYLINDILEDRGHNVSFVRQTEEAVEVLARAPVFVFPAPGLHNESLELPSDSQALLSAYVEEGGGVLVWVGNLELLSTTLPTLGLPEKGVLFSERYYGRTAAAADTPFEQRGPDKLEVMFLSQLLNMTAVEGEHAENLACLYSSNTTEGDEACALFSYRWGEGYIVFLGWSFFAGGIPASDGEGAPAKRASAVEYGLLFRLTPNWKKALLVAVEGFVAQREEEPSSSSSFDSGLTDEESYSEEESSAAKAVVGPFWNLLLV
ncbi:hypothetical protein QOT17_016060 [Balamuthia mandrillaris]